MKMALPILGKLAANTQPVFSKIREGVRASAYLCSAVENSIDTSHTRLGGGVPGTRTRTGHTSSVEGFVRVIGRAHAPH